MAPSHPSGPTLEALKHTLVLILEPLKHRLIALNRITERALIANGGFGAVREAELRDEPEATTFQRVAVKKLNPQGEDHERIELITAFARELKTWGATDHPNILPLIGFFLDPDSSVALFVSPFMPHGSIRTYLRIAQPNAAKRVDLALDIAEGLAYLHHRNPPISHGDIKPNNIVINHDSRAMLCDFGLARVVQDHPSGLTTAGFDEAGTLPYLSPELVLVPGTRRNAKTDTWAWGGVLVEVLTDNQPFKKCTSYFIPLKLKEGTLPAVVGELPISARMQVLLGRCWMKEPGERPDMSECSSELRLERSILGDPADTAVRATLGVSEVEPVPRSLIQALAALDSYRMSKEIIKFGVSEDDRLPFCVVPFASTYRATLGGAFRWATEGIAITVAKYSPPGERQERMAKAEKFIRQISIWVGSNHPNIYPLLGFSVDHDFGEIWFIGRLEPNGNLREYIEEVKPSQAAQIRLAVEVAQGLCSLHAQSPTVVHGDISGRTVIVGSAGQAMITGFHSAVVRESSGPTISHPMGGFLEWRAPEINGSHGLTPASDAWSFGCLLLEIFLQKYPSYGASPASAKVLSTLPEDLRNLTLACWKINPNERPTMQQCIDILTRLHEQEIQNSSPVVPVEAPSDAEESASESNSMPDAPDEDIVNLTDEALVVPEEVVRDQEEAQPEGSWCCLRCVIQ